LKELFAAYCSNGQNTVIAMFDIDHFKTVNDTYGHDFGDAVLRDTVQQIKQHVRQEDCLIRWGGDEFILILSMMTHAELERHLQRLNTCIRDHVFSTPGGVQHQVTISIGATCFQAGDSSSDNVLKRVDNALYQAKAIRDTFCISAIPDN